MNQINLNYQQRKAVKEGKIKPIELDEEITELVDQESNQSNTYDTYGVTEEQLEDPTFWINL